ncbi:MAG: MTH1187 family thiamine-binding protein [Methanomassiliicoccales archaeon]|nr:MTH1187 family thiamine-binding protein [Methanomassiliicoccales archaeon]
MIVEFSVMPIGVGTSLSKYVAECVRIVEDSGLKFHLTPMGTLLEGTEEEVMPVVMRCHERVMQMSDRVVTDIRIDDRKDRQASMERKMESVRRELKIK